MPQPLPPPVALDPVLSWDQEELLRRLRALEDAIAPAALGRRLRGAIGRLAPAEITQVARALDRILDLEERTVRDVMGRDGQLVAEHHYLAARSEDHEASWDLRPAVPAVRFLRAALLASLLGPRGIELSGLGLEAPSGTPGIGPLVEAARAGRRFLFIGNHESVLDLPVLEHALRQVGLPGLAEALTFFVNPKIFNMPFVSFFVCHGLNLIKVPQSPRIAALESVMASGEVRRRAAHGFRVAGEQLGAGGSLAIFPEGLRSEGLLHRFARAYLDLLRPATLARHGLGPDDVWLVPWAHQGVRSLEGAGAHAPRTRVRVRVGTPITPSRFFRVVGPHSGGVAGHVAGFLVARLLPVEQRGLYGRQPEAFLGHPHFRQRLRQHTLVEIRIARSLSERL